MIDYYHLIHDKNKKNKRLMIILIQVGKGFRFDASHGKKLVGTCFSTESGNLVPMVTC